MIFLRVYVHYTVPNCHTYRICPGRYMAIDSVFIMIATILTVFEIRPRIDESTGEPIEIKAEMKSALLS